MNKYKNLIIVLIIISLVFILVVLNTKNKSNKADNDFLLQKLNSLSIENIQDINITPMKNNGKNIKIIDSKESIKQILESLRLLDIGKENAKINNRINDDNVLYNILINEKNFYPESPIIISQHYIYYNGYEYYIDKNKIKNIISIIEERL